MDYTFLGQSKLWVSKICFGSLTLSPISANLPLAMGADLLKAAFDLGINFFDTAQLYQNYQYFEQAFAYTDKQVIIASKSYAETYREMALAVEEARLGLKRDRLDIMLLHEQRDDQAIIEHLPALEFLIDAKANGIISAIGISTHNVAAVRQATQMPEIDIIHAIYNQAGIGILGGNANDMAQAILAAKAAGKGVYGMKALGGGALINRAESALKWAFNQNIVDVWAIGMKDLAELSTNLAWYNGLVATQQDQVLAIDRNLAFESEPTCRKCGACLKRCAQEALFFKDDTIGWHKQKCLYCGYCIAACPWFCISFC